MIWVINTGLLLFALFAIGLGRKGKSAQSAVEFYKGQLLALERDRERGLIDDSGYQDARLEVERRLLRSKANDKPLPERPRGSMRLIMAIVAVPVVAISFILYQYLGSPHLPASPAARLTRGDQAISENGPTLFEAIEQIEQRLLISPDDKKGWEVLAASMRTVGDYQRAIDAFDQLIMLEPDRAEWRVKKYETFAEMTPGQINPAARLALIDLLSKAPNHPAGQFYLGQLYRNDNRIEEAREVWQRLLERSDPSAPWVDTVEAQLRAIGAESPAIDLDTLEAAASLNKQERADFIEAMIARLRARLDADPNDIAGWERLANSYVALGQNAAAIATLNEALTQVDEKHKESVRQILDNVSRKTNS